MTDESQTDAQKLDALFRSAPSKKHLVATALKAGVSPEYLALRYGIRDVEAMKLYQAKWRQHEADRQAQKLSRATRQDNASGGSPEIGHHASRSSRVESETPGPQDQNQVHPG